MAHASQISVMMINDQKYFEDVRTEFRKVSWLQSVPRHQHFYLLCSNNSLNELPNL